MQTLTQGYTLTDLFLLLMQHLNKPHNNDF
jgi:hypothetical protein